jgi:1-acyl-sn-glycerol-3-phosphate acyltransferase
VLIVANHQSFLDPPFIGLPLARPVAFLAKSELFESKLFGGAIRRLNAFPVRQGAGDIGAMRESVRLLKAGWALTIFPEGSRTFDGGLQPAQKGAGLLVKKADVPVVPAVIDGTFDAWPRGAKVPRPSPVRVLFGEPENLSGFKSDAIRQWVDERLAKLMAELRSR